LNSTSKSERLHIAIVGRRNVGKSSLINALVGQQLSIVSEVPGTTTDPVKKSIELLPFGPVVIIDTAGIDDEGELGCKRITQTMRTLSYADFAIVVLDAGCSLCEEELKLFDRLKKLNIPYLVVINKIEFGVNPELLGEIRNQDAFHFEISCKEKVGIELFKKKLIRSLPVEQEKPLIGDLVGQGDVIVLVVPIDLGAPKGRLIMPQVQTIREALDEDTIVVVVKDKELQSALNSLKLLPDLVVTDSQAIMRVVADLPEDVPVTTFSILMARLKGELPVFIKGLERVEQLQNGDKILISEACSHHAREDDIGSVKIPRWLRLHTSKDLQITHVRGQDFPDDLSEYKLIVHCGGCMLTRKQMLVRLNQAKLMNIPIVNYGVLISYMHGAIPKALKPFEEVKSDLENLQLLLN
jgi:[FeFe] hydrogenase H-cluster maturation GTPase HydF